MKGNVFIWAGCDDVGRHKQIASAIITLSVNMKLTGRDTGSVSIFISITFFKKKLTTIIKLYNKLIKNVNGLLRILLPNELCMCAG